jgi:hypothetical protein
MNIQMGVGYYLAQSSKLLAEFDREAQYWRQVTASQSGDDFADEVLRQARGQFENLIPVIPYIGGDDNPLTVHLVDATRCLALYRALKECGWTAAETGRILYDAVVLQSGVPGPPIPSSQLLSSEDLMKRRRKRAEKSQQRRYPGDWVYEFVQGDGEEFEYGYDFSECGVQKFYRAQGTEELLPFYCLLDYPQSEAAGLGLTRTMTIADGYDKCNHRFKKGRRTA